MKKFLIAAAVFLITGAGTYFAIKEKGSSLFGDSLSPAAVYEIISSPNASDPNAQVVAKHYGVYVYFVNYENDGFKPKNFAISVGNSAHFINNSNKALRVWSKNQSAPYNVLNQTSSIGKGEVYNFNFTARGVWEFYNLNNPNDTGSITVY